MGSVAIGPTVGYSASLRGRRIAVFGSDDFLGVHAENMLRDGGATVLGVQNVQERRLSARELVNGRREDSSRSHAAALNGLDELTDFLQASEVDYVLHLDGCNDIADASHTPLDSIYLDVMGTANVLEACCRAGGIKGVVVSSSAKVYGARGAPFSEESPVVAENMFGGTLAARDITAQSFSSRLPVRVARCANIIGPGDLQWSRLVPNATIRTMLGSAPYVVESQKNVTREFIDVSDVCTAFHRLLIDAELNRRIGGDCVFNVGSGERRTPLDVVAVIHQLFRRETAWQACPQRVTIQECGDESLDCSKLRGLGWTPLHHVDDAIARAVEWYVTNYPLFFGYIPSELRHLEPLGIVEHVASGKLFPETQRRRRQDGDGAGRQPDDVRE